MSPRPVAGRGVSLAYVFVHLLPELNEGQKVIAESVGGAFTLLESDKVHVALLGLAVFYGVERSASPSRRRRRASGKGDYTSEASSG